MKFHLAFLQNLGTGEIILILAVMLLLFGSNKLPKLARSLGSSMTEFKKGLRGESAAPEGEAKKLKDAAEVEEKKLKDAAEVEEKPKA